MMFSWYTILEDMFIYMCMYALVSLMFNLLIRL